MGHRCRGSSIGQRQGKRCSSRRCNEPQRVGRSGSRQAAAVDGASLGRSAQGLPGAMGHGQNHLGAVISKIGRPDSGRAVPMAFRDARPIR